MSASDGGAARKQWTDSGKREHPPEEGLLPAGTLVDGRYELLRVIGEGTFAAVYEAQHQGLRSRHAIKILHPFVARADETVRDRFVDEGRIQANLRHPNIVAVTEIVTDPLPGLVLEYVDGPNLYEYLVERGGRLSAEEALELMLPVMDALALAHSQRIVHRDLKPENILVGRDPAGRPMAKVADFGIAKALEESPFDSGKRRTRAGGKPLGTLLYLSPEQIRAPTEVDQRSDVFALGAILYELLTGELAFDAETEFEVQSRIVHGEYRPPEELVPGLAPQLVNCLNAALAPDPSQRIQDAGELHRQLVALSDGEVARRRSASVPEPRRSVASRDRQEMTERLAVVSEDIFRLALSLKTESPDEFQRLVGIFEKHYEHPWIERSGESIVFHPPEVLKGWPFDERSWVYYFSCILYAELARRPPVEARGHEALRAAIHEGQIVPLDHLVPVDPQISAAVMRGLSLRQKDRQQDISELLAELGFPELNLAIAQRQNDLATDEASNSSAASVFAWVAGFIFIMFLFSVCAS